MTKDELKLKITAAYDDYLDAIEALGRRITPSPPRRPGRSKMTRAPMLPPRICGPSSAPSRTG